MWRIKLTFFILMSITICSAQKNDYHWLHGYDYGIKQDTFIWGVNHLNFNNTPFTITRDSLAMWFNRTSTTVSDDTGALLFYTNGIYIANSYNEKVQGSDSMNAGYVSYVWDPDIGKHGYRTPQGIIALQQPDSPNIYHLIHSFTDTFGTYLHIPKILETVLDVKRNNGHGQVISKNRTILQGGNYGGAQKAVKHANGKDWWLVVHKRPSYFQKLLLTSKGWQLDSVQDFSVVQSTIDDIDIATFSPDGSKYVFLGSTGGLCIFDFNRCTGNLSNLVNIPLPIINDSTWIGIGVEISPNSRYLYVSITKRIYQYDLQASDIAGSAILVAQYDGFFEDYPIIQTLFCTSQLAPDGKIYMNTGNGTHYYHVIENPNLAGLNCNVNQHGVNLLGYCLGIPNYPNYRLGALQGNCGVGIIEPLAAGAVRMYPNPSQGNCIVDYGQIEWEQSTDVQLHITDVLGALVYHTKLPEYSGIHALHMDDWNSGLYIVTLLQRGQQIWRGKLVKE
ncbi:MAG: T9SS type A sorting domain-containing protein [Chitinophagales bacterium]|nr:T9SS type A sorting domain-containing protein [Chitinophagales bacterium]